MKSVSLSNLFMAVSAALLLAVSCSIKESRVPCPCYIKVGFDDREHITEDVTVMGWRDGELFRKDIDVSEYDPYWVTAVHKGSLQVMACLGLDGNVSEGHYAIIPFGNECDSLYAYFEPVDATGDDVTVEAHLKKQFATVHVDISKDASQMVEYDFIVDGNSCGFDLMDFSPVEGPFHCEPVPAKGSRLVVFRVPRQKDASLRMTVFKGDLDLGSFPIGDYMRRLNYNWDAQELQDIYITIDFIVGQVVIGIDDWETGVMMTFIEQ